MDTTVIIVENGDYIPNIEVEVIRQFIEDNDLKNVSIIFSFLPVPFPTKEGDIIISKKIKEGVYEGAYLPISLLKNRYSVDDLKNFLITTFSCIDELMPKLLANISIQTLLSNSNEPVLEFCSMQKIKEALN